MWASAWRMLAILEDGSWGVLAIFEAGSVRVLVILGGVCQARCLLPSGVASRGTSKLPLRSNEGTIPNAPRFLYENASLSIQKLLLRAVFAPHFHCELAKKCHPLAPIHSGNRHLTWQPLRRL